MAIESPAPVSNITTSRAWPLATMLIGLGCVTMFVLLQGMHLPAIVGWREQWRLLGPVEAFQTQRYWKLVLPATLMHANINHIVANMWCLWVLGSWFERRYRSGLLIALWLLAGCVVMGLEIRLTGVSKVGLSELTYTLLGVALVDYRAWMHQPRMRWTAIVMLGVLGFGLLELLGALRTDSGIGNVAHLLAVPLGVALGLSARRTRFAARVD